MTERDALQSNAASLRVGCSQSVLGSSARDQHRSTRTCQKRRACRTPARYESLSVALCLLSSLAWLLCYEKTRALTWRRAVLMLLRFDVLWFVSRRVSRSSVTMSTISSSPS
jgi:hypothetical protein